MPKKFYFGLVYQDFLSVEHPQLLATKPMLTAFLPWLSNIGVE